MKMRELPVAPASAGGFSCERLTVVRIQTAPAEAGATKLLVPILRHVAGGYRPVPVLAGGGHDRRHVFLQQIPLLD